VVSYQDFETARVLKKSTRQFSESAGFDLRILAVRTSLRQEYLFEE